MRIRCFLFAGLLLVTATPSHASLGVAPQCVAPSQDLPTKVGDAKSPLPELPRVASSYDAEDRDYLIRTIAFEAGEEPDEGKAAVAHVVLNRERSGRWGSTIKQVVTRPWQFEPWMTRRREIGRLSPSDPLYRDAARIADAVLSGEIPDPTAGATHFLNPTIVRQRRGGSLPSWAQGEGQPIGQHTFYAPNGGVPEVEGTVLPADAWEVVTIPCSGSEASKTPESGLMTLAGGED
ncbi:cell wall hydrolase [Methyloceanibacter sp.]|uniref:cell wall hydrolase n=1 Tax=Methyloceanibacter sp. TaxID=1965321 RepID=UPI002D4CFC45|nr:cell wall hydrolase [Methyloceanibacter sp.]HZP08070.1 cell wall hydrolase [Methyloceanibacter sp.]